MNTTDSLCTCTEDGYSPECPQAFVQNGQVLHVLTGSDKLKPRKYVSDGKMTSGTLSAGKNLDQEKKQFQAEQVHAMRYLDSESTTSSDDEIYENQLLNDKAYQQAVAAVERTNMIKMTKLHRSIPQNFQTDSDMMQGNRTILKKFEALRVGDQSLTEMSIGGYQIDLSKAAQKAKEIAPLPPAKLPIIFKDGDMNFYHHFFQGLEMMIGRSTLVDLVNTNVYFNEGENLLYGLIEGMIKAGHEKSDSDLTLFTKNVLTSTFSIDESADHGRNGKYLIVDANLWGLQYIESGMQCKEADLKMWLSICYSYYRGLWFNTFKSAGIPSFALEGVQSRYEEKSKVPSHNILQKKKSIDEFIDKRLANLGKYIDHSERMIEKENKKSSKHRSSRRH